MLRFPFLVFSLFVSFSLLLLLFCFNTFKIKIQYNINSGLHGETLCNFPLDDSCAPSKPTDLSTQFSLISKTYWFSVSCVSFSRIIKPFQGSVCTVGFSLPDWLCSLQIVRLYWNKLAASLSINQFIVGRSPAELSGPVSAFLQLAPDTNHCVQSALTSVWWPVVSSGLVLLSGVVAQRARHCSLRKEEVMKYT